jgi:hypothetical protein
MCPYTAVERALLDIRLYLVIRSNAVIFHAPFHVPRFALPCDPSQWRPIIAWLGCPSWFIVSFMRIFYLLVTQCRSELFDFRLFKLELRMSKVNFATHLNRIEHYYIL